MLFRSEPANVGRAVPLDKLLATILDRSEAAPQRRQAKMRVAGGARR